MHPVIPTKLLASSTLNVYACPFTPRFKEYNAGETQQPMEGTTPCGPRDSSFPDPQLTDANDIRTVDESQNSLIVGSFKDGSDSLDVPYDACTIEEARQLLPSDLLDEVFACR